MSSYIPSAKHFNSAEKSLHTMLIGSDFYWPYKVKKTFPDLDRIKSPETQERVVSEVLDTLRELTALCVCLQYKHHYEGTLDKEIENQRTGLMESKGGSWERLNNIGLFKCLKCIDYQIETSHLKQLRSLTEQESNAMLFLDEMTIHLAIEIVRALPEYEAAEWSID